LNDQPSSCSSRGPDSDARAQVALSQTLRCRAQPVERPQDLPAEEQGTGQRAERRDDDDRPELLLVVHAEHDDARADDRRERKTHGGDRKQREAPPDAHPRNL